MATVLTFGIPIIEGIRTAHAQGVKSPVYKKNVNPFYLNEKMLEFIERFDFGTDREKVEILHETLRRGAPEGIRIVKDMLGKTPRTAAEALAKGGDCTELANVAIAMMEDMGVPGGALIVHFKGTAADELHMIPYAKLDGKRVIIDLQTPKLGTTAEGGYTVVMSLTYAQSQAMYHREWGDYFKNKGQTKQAIKAYERSLEIHEKDAYVHYNLSVLHGRSGNKEKGIKHLKRAAELAPKRYKSKQKSRGSYNEELRKGEKAYRAGKWVECAMHFQNALDAGEKLKAKERRVIKQYRDACKKKQNN
jgi:tetratricopeptide (TPR) repeat protein